MKIKHFVRHILILMSVLAVVACSSSSDSSAVVKNAHVKALKGGSKEYSNYDRPASLPRNPSQVKVKVSLSKQMAYLMEGSRPLLVMPVSTGKRGKGRETPTGNYRILFKNHKHRATSHGYAYTNRFIKGSIPIEERPAGWSWKGTPMPYWCAFTNQGHGFHTGWVHSGANSHGCIRMYENIAPKFFRLVKVGTPVNIAYSQPEDLSIGANVQRGPDAKPLADYPAAYYLKDYYFTKHKAPAFQN